MRKLNKKHFWIAGIVVTAVSLILFIVGFGIVLGNDIKFKNVLAFLVASVIYGTIAALLYYLRAKLAIILYLLGVAMGFIDMYRIFLSKMNGWGDLIGITSLWMWSAIGLIAGVVVQALYYVYNRYFRKG